MIPLAEAKKLVYEKYGFAITEELDLGKMPPRGDLVKGEARASPKEIAVRADLDDTMKLIAIAHEAGHLIDYSQNEKEYLRGGVIKDETKAWLNGLPLAIEMGIQNEYITYWKIHLEKL